MKIKMLSMIMSMFSLTACASCITTDDDPITENPAPEPTPGTEAGDNVSVLVAYFSCTGTTEGIAEGIADITGASTFRIEAEEPYTAADLDYNSDCRANREQNNPKARPAIKSMPDGLDRYDVVFLGYPIWWGEAPRIISTFLERGDFKGKTIVPFCTSHSSGLGSSDRNLHSLAPDAVWIPGRRFAGNTSKSELEKWISGLDIKFDTDMDYSKFPLSEGKNGQAPTIRLSSGYDMPVVGLGTYSLTGDVCVNSVKSAISLGFRKIDTAHMYGNEVEVGRGVRESGVPREEIFVATKIYPNQYGNPEAAIEECLRKLDLGYVDLMLLHHPGTNDVKAYKAMERYVREGKNPLHRRVMLLYQGNRRFHPSGRYKACACTERGSSLLSGHRCRSLYPESRNSGRGVVSVRGQRASEGIAERPATDRNRHAARQISRTGHSALGLAAWCCRNSRIKQSRPHEGEHLHI